MTFTKSQFASFFFPNFKVKRESFFFLWNKYCIFFTRKNTRSQNTSDSEEICPMNNTSAQYFSDKHCWEKYFFFLLTLRCCAREMYHKTQRIVQHTHENVVRLIRRVSSTSVSFLVFSLFWLLCGSLFIIRSFIDARNNHQKHYLLRKQTAPQRTRRYFSKLLINKLHWQINVVGIFFIIAKGELAETLFWVCKRKRQRYRIYRTICGAER